MRVLRKGLSGADVEQWELFLHGHGFTFTKPRDAQFDAETEKLTKEFQKKNKLVADGIVGNATFGVAMQQGFEAVPFTGEPEAKFPDKPDFDPIVGTHVVVDLGSTNGVYDRIEVDTGVQPATTPLREGDQVEFGVKGEVVLIYELRPLARGAQVEHVRVGA